MTSAIGHQDHRVALRLLACSHCPDEYSFGHRFGCARVVNERGRPCFEAYWKMIHDLDRDGCPHPDGTRFTAQSFADFECGSCPDQAPLRTASEGISNQQKTGSHIRQDGREPASATAIRVADQHPNNTRTWEAGSSAKSWGDINATVGDNYRTLGCGGEIFVCFLGVCGQVRAARGHV